LLTSVWAQVQWEKESLELQAPPGKGEVVGVYRCKNMGDKEVRLQVQAACPCLRVELSKNPLPPGESAELKATFIIGDKEGEQNVLLDVQTDGKEARDTTLKLRIKIPELIKLSTKLLSWRIGELRPTKTLDVQAATDLPIKVVKVRAINNACNVTVQLETVEDGKHYRIHVTPDATINKPCVSMIAIATDQPREKPRTYLVYASLRPVLSAPVQSNPPVSTHFQPAEIPGTILENVPATQPVGARGSH